MQYQQQSWANNGGGGVPVPVPVPVPQYQYETNATNDHNIQYNEEEEVEEDIVTDHFGTTSTRATPLDAAFDRARDQLANDMPLLLHGSGDVPPSDVSNETCQIVAAMTLRYMSQLVDAAIDAQDMLCDIGVVSTNTSVRMSGGGGGGANRHRQLMKLKRKRYHQIQHQRAIIPPPSYPKERKPHQPLMTPEEEQDFKQKNKRKKKVVDEFWDEPLPKPKIKNRNNSNPLQAEEASSASAAAAIPTMGPPISTLGDEDEEEEEEENNGTKNDGMTNDKPQKKRVHVDDWVGLSGVDLFETSRTRSAYVRGPSALTTQNFIFPICHDVYAYGRVLNVQTSKRNTSSVLLDPVVMEMVQNEGQFQQKQNKKKVQFNKKSKQKQQQKEHGKKSGSGGDGDGSGTQGDRKKNAGSKSGGGGGADGKGGGAGAAGTSDPEDEDNDNDDDLEDEEDDLLDDAAEDGPAWPGLEHILPMHRSKRPFMS